MYETTFQSVPKKKHVNCGFSITTDERTYNLVAEVSNTLKHLDYCIGGMHLTIY